MYNFRPAAGVANRVGPTVDQEITQNNLSLLFEFCVAVRKKAYSAKSPNGLRMPPTEATTPKKPSCNPLLFLPRLLLKVTKS